MKLSYVIWLKHKHCDICWIELVFLKIPCNLAIPNSSQVVIIIEEIHCDFSNVVFRCSQVSIDIKCYTSIWHPRFNLYNLPTNSLMTRYNKYVWSNLLQALLIVLCVWSFIKNLTFREVLIPIFDSIANKKVLYT